MNDDWKGEHLLAVRPDRATENSRVVSQTWHNKRKKLGIPAPSSKSHSVFVRTAFKWIKQLDDKK